MTDNSNDITANLQRAETSIRAAKDMIEKGYYDIAASRSIGATQLAQDKPLAHLKHVLHVHPFFTLCLGPLYQKCPLLFPIHQVSRARITVNCNFNVKGGRVPARGSPLDGGRPRPDVERQGYSYQLLFWFDSAV